MFSTHDEEEREEESFDPRVQTPSHAESTDDESNEESDEEVQGTNSEDKEMDEEATHEDDEANKLYREVNINLEGRDIVMTDAPLLTVQATQEIEDTHVIITALITPKGVSVTTIAEPPLVFDHRLKTLETNFTEFKQTNQFAEAVSSIPGIVDAYLANKMHEVVKTVVQLQSKRLRDEAQAKNAGFLNKLNDNIKKIIKDQVKEQVKSQVLKILPKIEKTVNEQLKAEVMSHSSTESKTSLAIAANLSELELKKIRIDKMESNKSIHRSDEQKNLYKALVEAYESDKLILDTYGEVSRISQINDKKIPEEIFPG
ncbi:hypothetical protein Tco_0774836, partial [Tanacetum coccineum]